MNSRQRVLLALNHQEPDRVPIELGVTIVSSIACTSHTGFSTHLGKTDKQIQMLTYRDGLRVSMGRRRWARRSRE